MPYVERRGDSVRVKWWGGEYKLDADGKPTNIKKYESASGPEPGAKFADDDEAKNFGLDREYDVRHGKHIRRADGKTLMGDYCKHWLEAQDIRQTSVRTYASLLRSQIVPRWGQIAVGDVSAWGYDAWRKQLKAGPLSKKYVDQILSLFNILMTDAVSKYKLRADSPIVVQRRRGRYEKKAREKKRPMQMAVLHQLATNAYTVLGYTGWVCMWTIAFTGMRPPGEVFGLRREFASPNWPLSDPDGERRDESIERYGSMPAIRVQYQVQYEHGRRELVAPKYDSHRTLVLPPFLHEMHEQLLASHDSPWVFPAATGGHMGTQWADIYWKAIRNGAPARSGRRDWARPEIPPVPEMAGKRIYLLRHWMKEMMSEDNHPRVAQETRMGHEVAGVEGLYSNLTPKMELAVAESLQERWERFMGDGIWLPPFPTLLPFDLPDSLSSEVTAV